MAVDSGTEPDVTWQSARAASQAVADAASIGAERQGFTYRGGRDVTGFIVGTANPQVRQAADVALIRQASLEKAEVTCW
jgi:deferrochelatase/peroxidase EfeB